MSRHVVATVDEIAPGKSKLVTVKGREIGVFNVDGSFYALANRCPHAGGALCEGAIVGLVQSDGPGNYRIARQGEFVRCPWHGWEYEIATGQSWCDPEEPEDPAVHGRGRARRGTGEGPLRGGDLPGLGREAIRRCRDVTPSCRDVTPTTRVLFA